MSDRDILGEAVRNLVAIPTEYLPSVNQHLEALRGEKGEEWYRATKRFLRKEDPWVPKTESGLVVPRPIIPIRDVYEQIGLWGDLYRKHFGIDLKHAICLPAHKPGFDRLNIVAQGMSPNRAYDACNALFPCRRYTDDLDVAVTKNDRDSSSGTYAIWVRDTQEADRETRNLSATDLEVKKIPCITLLERLLFELIYFEQTGKHLDIESWTLCSGSRTSYGYVPLVYWFDGKLTVNWYHVGDRHGPLGARELVS